MKTSGRALLLLLFTASPAFAQTNYCHDPAAETEWSELIAKNPQGDRLQALHAIRIDLCAKVDRGDLTVERAKTIFETAREALVRGVQREKMEDGFRGGGEWPRGQVDGNDRSGVFGVW